MICTGERNITALTVVYGGVYCKQIFSVLVVNIVLSMSQPYFFKLVCTTKDFCR